MLGITSRLRCRAQSLSRSTGSRKHRRTRFAAARGKCFADTHHSCNQTAVRIACDRLIPRPAAAASRASRSAICEARTPNGSHPARKLGFARRAHAITTVTPLRSTNLPAAIPLQQHTVPRHTPQPFLCPLDRTQEAARLLTGHRPRLAAGSAPFTAPAHVSSRRVATPKMEATPCGCGKPSRADFGSVLTAARECPGHP